MPRLYKKLARGKELGQLSCPASVQMTNNDYKTTVILDYVLAHAKGDQRPFLSVSIFGKELLGLLDSGASKTIVGSSGWEILKPLCKLHPSPMTNCTVANGQNCSIAGMLRLPISLRDRVILLETLVVPSLPHTLILGIDFWTRMGIIPDLNAGEWFFHNDQPKVATISSAITPNDSLPSEQQKRLELVIKDIFCSMKSEIGCTNLVELKIKTNSDPIKQRYYPLSRVLQNEVNAELEEMLRKDIIEPSNSPWSSPIVMVRKSGGGWRFCVDYRSLNRVTVKDSYPIPFVSATLDKLRDARFLSTLDIKSAYWQIPVSKESRPLTAFTVPNRGLFQFKRMPFGLANAPAVWQRLIDQVVGVDLEQFVFVYLDDVIICTPTFDQHINILREVVSRISKAGLTLNREKCNFCKSELRYLGYIVNASGLLVDPEKVEAIMSIPPPKNISDIRRIIGMASWYRRFVPNFSTLVAPLTALTRKNTKFNWNSDCDSAFNAVKEHLIRAPILTCPDFDKPFIIQCDASDFGVGAVLTQGQNDDERVISYLSRSLTKSERRYSTTEKECLAVLFAIEKLRPYIEGTHFTVVTDHYSLKWLNSIKDPVGRIARWAVRLQQYDFEVIHRKGKDNVVPDALSRSVPVVEPVSVPAIPSMPSNKLDVPPSESDPWYCRMVTNVQNSPAKFPKWWLDDGKLYKCAKTVYPALMDSRDSWLLVVPRDQRLAILRDHHDPPTCGHLGISKTFARIAQHYYWPKMRSSVTRYVNRCEVCLKTKPLQRASAGQMLSQQPTASRPFQILSIDLVGPLPRSNSGYSYVLSVHDVFSKYPLFFPLRSATTKTVLRWLEDHVILVYGIPEKIIADNGPQFRSKVFQETLQGYGISLRFTAHYHPQANPVERVHRVLKTIISSYVENNHKTWDTFLAKAGCAIRSAKHEVTGLTPNFVVFGRDPKFIPGPDIANKSPTRYDPVQRALTLEKVFVDVQKRLQDSFNKTRDRYNLRHRNEKFALNQQVWRRNHIISSAANQFTAKFAPKFRGPFIISKILSPWSYELTDSSGRIQGVWHAKDLKSHPPELPGK